MANELRAWCNREIGEVVAATSAAEARGLLVSGAANGASGVSSYEADDPALDDDEWATLKDDFRYLEEDGSRCVETVGQMVAKLGKPGYLYSLEL